MSDSNPEKLGDCSLHRRRLLTLLPASVAASAIPNTNVASAPAPVSVSEIQASLLGLWGGRPKQATAYIRPSSIETVNGMIAGCYTAFVSLSPAGATHSNPHQSFWDSSSRFGRITVEVTFRQKVGLFRSKPVIEHCYLLRGKSTCDSGNMIGFLRQTVPLYGQRFVIYKPYNHWAAQLIGTTDGLVPKKLQSVCIGEFKAERFADFFQLLRGGQSELVVERIRFPYRRPYLPEMEY